MIVLTFGTRLNARSWAAAMAALPGRYGNDSLTGEQVLVDLTELGFADFVTLGHLLVFVRAAVTAGATCTVRLPSAEDLPTGTPQDPSVALRIIRRHNCRLYLEQAGVVDALRPYVDNEPRSEADAAAPTADGEALSRPARSERPHRYRRIMRYRWMSAESVQDITLATLPTEPERTLRELGIPSEIAAAVTRGIVLELLENAQRHSGASEVLLGGVVVDPDTYGSRADDFDPAMRAFAWRAAAASSPLIRLVVADTGHGMARLGGPGAIVGALDARASRTGSGTGGAQGLWKVSRVVRAYQGALLISTGGEVAGRIYNLGDAQDVTSSAPAALPRTLVECAVLTRPGAAALQDAGELGTPRRRPASQPELTCIAAPLYSPIGLREEDQARVRNLLAGTTGLVVAVNVPYGGDGAHDVEIGHAIAQIIGIAAWNRAARPVTLAFPSVNRPLMSVAVEYLNAEHDEEVAAGAAVPPPILVLAPNNRHYWAGGTSAQRRVLGRLSIAIGPVLISSLSADEAAVVADLADQTALLLTGEGMVALRTPPQDAVTAMAGWVGHEIARTIADAPAASGPRYVWRGKYLTPCLRVTSRWFDLDTLLSRLDLAALAGISLAARVEDALDEPGDWASLVILRLAHTPPETVAAFARSLPGRVDYVDSLRDVPPADRSTVDPVRVLVVTDVVSSRTTLVRALSDVLDREMDPVAVATVVDARAEDNRAADPHYVELPGRRVPLIYLATVDVAPADDPEDPVPIDAVLRRPENGRRPTPRQLIRQDVYVGVMQRNAAARLGHIERPADRHYTAYVDPTLLFRLEEWSQEVLGELGQEIKRRHSESFDTEGATACVLFPEGTADDLTTAARRLQKALIKAGLELDDPVAVPRAAHAANWQLPGSVSLPPVKHAIVLDSGASSGRTVQQLVGLAADSDVVTITVVLLLNGMSDGDAVNLQRIATVRRSDPESSFGSAALETIYIAKTAMSSVSSGHCAVCALRHRYGSLTLYAPIPQALAAHRQWLLRMLETRTKQELFEEQAADLFGANVSQPECVEYLSWRLRLREAALNTERRKRVFERLVAARENQLSRDALVRLLVAEPQWLHSAPLWFPACREMISEMAASMLVNNAALLIEQRLRVQAVILLAQAAPERLAADLSRILRTNRGEGLVIEQVLLETLLLVSARTGRAPFGRHRVARRLTESLVELQDRLRDKDSAATVASEFVTLPLIRYLLSHARRPLQVRPEDPQAAWSALRHEMNSVAHDFANQVWLVRTGIELAAEGGEIGDLDEIRNSWTICANYLHQTALPNVEPLRDILLSKTVLGDMSREEAVRWEETLSAEGGRAVDETTVRIDDIVDKVKMGAPPGPDEVDAVLADLEWWPRFVLDPQRAILQKVITRGPIDVMRIVRTFFQGPADTIDDDRLASEHRDGLFAFCTSRLINDVLSHIRINAEITHRVAGSEQRFLVVLDQPHPDRVTVTVRNTGSTRESPGGGKGLETLEHRLARFGGTIEEAEVEPPWTYAITVGLDRWRMPA